MLQLSLVSFNILDSIICVRWEEKQQKAQQAT